MNSNDEIIEISQQQKEAPQLFHIEEESAAFTTAQQRRNVILLHGWNSKAADMVAVQNALRARATPNWQIYNINYDSWGSTFREAAGDVIEYMTQQGGLNIPTVLIGYSMGGIVARQMAADGYPCSALVTICAPHLGTGHWVPGVTDGAASIAVGSKDLHHLNQSPADKKLRNRYHFFGFTYKDIAGHHDDDAVVPKTSAMGAGLGPEIKRHLNHLVYTGGFAGAQPHWAGMNAEDITAALTICEHLFKTI